MASYLEQFVPVSGAATVVPSLSSAAASALSSTPSSVWGTAGTGAGSTGAGAKIGQTNVAIPQDERLFSARPRSISIHNQVGDDGDRGTRAFIKLLTNSKSDPFTRQGDPGSVKATSLGTNKSGALNNLVNGNATKGNGFADGYASFLVTGISCQMSEKVQVTQVFGDAEVVYYFGRNPVTLSIQGMLVDSVDNNWFVEWLELYSYHMRGSQLARNYELLKLVLPNMTITGSITGMNWQQDSMNDVQVPFGFQFLAKTIEPTAAVLDMTTAISESVVLTFAAADPISLSKKAQNAVLKFSALQDISKAIASPAATLNGLTGLFGGVGSPSGVSKWIDGLTSKADSAVSSVLSGGGILTSVSSSLNGIRTNLFAPILGVMSSLTKLVSTLSGGLQALSSGIPNAVNNILRDINSIASQASGLVSLVTGGINSVTAMNNQMAANVNSTIANLKKTAGTISAAPTTIGDALRGMVNSGRLSSNAGFIQSTSLTARLPPTFLSQNGGTRNSAAAILFLASAGSSNKLALLNSGPVHTPQAGARL